MLEKARQARRQRGDRGREPPDAHSAKPLHRADALYLQPHRVAGLGGVGRRQHTGDDALAGAQPLAGAGQAVGHHAHHFLEAGARLLGLDPVLLRAVHHDACRTHPGAHAPGPPRILGWPAHFNPRPEGHGAVEDVAGQDRLGVLLEVGRVGQLEGRKQGHDRATVVAQLHRQLGLDHHRAAVAERPLRAVLEQAVAGEVAGQRAVEAELALDLRHVEADLPAQRLGALCERLAPAHEQRGGAALHVVHGVITIFSASRRS